MNLSRTKGLGVIATVSALALALSACGSDNTSTNTATGSPAVSDMATGSATDAGTSSAATVDLSGSFAGAGASSQENAMNAWRSEFQNQYPNVTISYDPVGSGGGREQFLAGAISFGGSDRASRKKN